MSTNKVETPGDAKFLAAKNTFDRLHRKFPLPMEAEIEMILLCFHTSLMPTVNRIILADSDATSDQLWKKLSDALYNDSQIQAHHSSFMRLNWTEGSETITEYASKVRALGENLEVSNQMMKAAFIQGLPKRYQSLVFGDRGTFDSVVAYTSTLVDSGLVKRTEGVREVIESKTDASQSRHYSRRVCYACGDVGHIAKDPVCKRYKERRDNLSTKDNKDTQGTNDIESKKETGGTPQKKE